MLNCVRLFIVFLVFMESSPAPPAPTDDTAIYCKDPNPEFDVASSQWHRLQGIQIIIAEQSVEIRNGQTNGQKKNSLVK